MSYSDIFNGEYNHEPLFKVGANLWFADWDTCKRTYDALPVILTSVHISPDDTVYYEVQTGKDKEPPIECYSEDLYADRVTAKDYARQKLLEELDSELRHRKTDVDEKRCAYVEAQRVYHELEFFLLGFRKMEAAKQLPDI